jgi:alginate O-acetyltransferase complex protein AlgI
MVFSSVTFLYFFLPLFLVLYLIVPFRNAALLTASLFFYAWGEQSYLLVLLGSIAVNYAFGLAIARFPAYASWTLGGGVAANLALLSIFKYADFALQSLAPLLGSWPLAASHTPVHLPIGISFFTFQAISYLVDVRRGIAKVERNPVVLATYISMFPQLIAGPIVRFATIQDALHDRSLGLGSFERGVRCSVIGLGQKVLIANTLAVPADAIFGLPASELTFSVSWLGAICYTLQIYYDFAGYSNMAIGLGHMLGFELPQNFDYPYIASSITEFWRRWHLTLSRWFRDYLYIPLGGNRRGAARTYRNLLVVFLLCGLWHGAAWTFVVWGAYHGSFLVLERIGLAARLERGWRPLRHAYCLLVITVGFVIFRADSLSQAGDLLQAMLGLGRGSGLAYHPSVYLQANVVLVLALAVVGAMPTLPALGVWLARRADSSPALFAVRTSVVSALLGVMLLTAMTLAAGTHNPFIYFRF